MSKKICAFIGTNNRDSSAVAYTEQVVNLLAEQIDIEFKLYTAYNSSLNVCRGCTQCFSTHKCPLDDIDDAKKIKADLQSADFIILGGPVYLHNVNGITKNFIDRVSYWCHMFALRGKNAMTIASADSNGMKFVESYLGKCLSYFGCPVVTHADVVMVNGNDDGKKQKHVKKIMESLEQPVISNELIDNIFIALKPVMLAKRKLDGTDVAYMYWKENKLLDAKSYTDAVTYYN